MAPVEVLPLLRPPGTELPAITGTIRRNAALMLLQFILPTIAILLFCTCISENPHSIPVAVYDGDQTPFSRQILSTLNSSDMIKLQHHYNTSEEAIDAVRRGTASIALIIYPHFSYCLYERMTSLGSELEDGEFFNSTIHLHPDMSNNQLVITAVEEEVKRVLLTIAPPFLEEYGASSELLKTPIAMEEPVYGRKDPIYFHYMLPGIILSSSCFIASLLTAMILIVERKEHGLNASYRKNSIVLLLTQACILFISSGMVVLFVFLVFGINYHGHLFLIFALTFLQSLAGMSFGVLLSALTKNESIATLMSLGFFYLNLLLNGTIWPAQTLRPWVQIFANYLPQTMAINSMRTIITRGWTLVEGEVRCGFAVTLLWIGIFLGLSLIVFKCRKF